MHVLLLLGNKVDSSTKRTSEMSKKQEAHQDLSIDDSSEKKSLGIEEIASSGDFVPSASINQEDTIKTGMIHKLISDSKFA